MIETLFTSSNYESTPCFDRLRALRRSVLSKTLVEEFISYIRGQIVVHQRKGLKGKRLYHIIRLLFELKRILRGEDPVIAFPVRDANSYFPMTETRLTHMLTPCYPYLRTEKREIDSYLSEVWQNPDLR